MVQTLETRSSDTGIGVNNLMVYLFTKYCVRCHSTVQVRGKGSVRRFTVGCTTRVRFPGRAGIFLFATASRPASGPIQSHSQWAPGGSNPGLNRPEYEDDH
jgi:hypothetical protein